jgi:hypothetical protein
MGLGTALTRSQLFGSNGSGTIPGVPTRDGSWTRLVGAGVMPREDHIMDFSSPRAANETETFFDLIPHPRDTFEKAKAAAEHTAELVQAACTTTYDSAAALNVELIEAGRSNLNATLEFTREAIALKSPAELPAVMNAYARKQFERWIEQTRQFSNFAQKVAHGVVCNGSGKAFRQAA